MVNGYSATFGRAVESFSTSDDFPTFGNPAITTVGDIGSSWGRTFRNFAISASLTRSGSTSRTKLAIRP